MKKLVSLLILASLCTAIGCSQSAQTPMTVSSEETTQERGYTEASPYIITTADDLFAFVSQYNDYQLNQDAYAILTNDIRINDITDWENWLTDGDADTLRDWTPIHTFYGTFDGQGHQITGLYCHITEEEKGSSASFGLINTSFGTVKNLTIAQSAFYSDCAHAGIIVGRNEGVISDCNTEVHFAATGGGGICFSNDEQATIQNCHVAGSFNSLYNGNSQSFGGICGSNKGTILSCTNQASMFCKTGTTAGGICGYNLGIVQDSHNAGAIDGVGAEVGGIVGNNHHNVTSGIIIGCSNTATIITSYDGAPDAGGLAAINKGEIRDSYNTGNITCSYSAGGLTAQNNGTITNCWNTGSVYGEREAAGLSVLNYATIRTCSNRGSITAAEKEAAGCVCLNSDESILENCYNSGSVESVQYEAFGICALNYNSISNVYNAGSITAAHMASALVGTSYDGPLLCCYNLGNITCSNTAYALFFLGVNSYADACYNAGVITDEGGPYEAWWQWDGEIGNCDIERIGDPTRADYWNFDFETIWIMSEDPSYPYPVLLGAPVCE